MRTRTECGRHVLGVLVAAALLGGCTTSREASNRKETAVGQQLVVEGLGQLRGVRQTADRVGVRLEELLAAGRTTSAGLEADRFPDLWLPLLSARPKHLPRTVYFLAGRFDARAEGTGGWRAELEAAGPESAVAQEIAEQRALFLGRMERGLFDQALDGAPAPDEDGGWVAVDRAELRAWALRFAGRNDEARGAFQRAAELSAPLDRRTSDRYRLLQLAITPNEQRGSKELETWTEIAGRIDLSTARDPEMLQVLHRSRPVGALWPAETTPRTLLARVGQLHLDRGEAKAALLALQSAEAHGGVEPTRARLRLGQVQAFSMLGRNDVARTLCVELADSELRSEALVALGILEVHEDRVERARSWMEAGLRSVPITEAPTQHADLALVELLCGADEQGLDRLAACKMKLRESSQLEALLQLLENERAFHQSVGHGEDAQRVAMELRRLEASPDPAY